MQVIYGDTDSIMVHSNTDDLREAKKMADMLKREVNKHYRCMEIDIDGVMKSMLLLKKKKYAALAIIEGKDGTFRTERETKGLDIVRRDWCGLAHRIGNIILNKVSTVPSCRICAVYIFCKLKGGGKSAFAVVCCIALSPLVVSSRVRAPTFSCLILCLCLCCVFFYPL